MSPSIRDELSAYLDDTAPDRARREALKAEILADRPSRSHRRTGLAVGGLAAAAAAAAIAVGWPLATEPPVPLAATEQAVEVQPDVVVIPSGEGEATPGRIAWERGKVRVEVTPHRGVALEVVTDEATVRVVGTVFEVERDGFGTAVAVERGHVEVSCLGSGPRQLETGGLTRCFPSAETGVGYVSELQRRGAPATDWLAAVDAARSAPSSRPETPAVLLALEVDALLVLGRPTEATALAARALSEGREVLDRTLSAVAADRVGAGDCAGAVAALEALAARGDAAAEAWLARCR